MPYGKASRVDNEVADVHSWNLSGDHIFISQSAAAIILERLKPLTSISTVWCKLQLITNLIVKSNSLELGCTIK